MSHYTKLGLIAVAMVLAGTASAETFNIARDSFSITIPPSWEEVPESAIAEKTAAIRKAAPQVPYPAFHYAYQARSDGWFSLPYVTVWVDRSGRLPEKGLEEIAKRESQIRDYAKSKTADFLPQFEMNTPFYDSARHIVWLTIAANYAGVGKIDILSAAIQTEEGAIWVYGYSRPADFEAYKPTFIEIAQSVHPSEALRYKPRSADSSPARGVADFVGETATDRATIRSRITLPTHSSVWAFLPLVVATLPFLIAMCIVDTRTLRKLLPYLGFLCLFIGMFGRGHGSAPLEIAASIVALLSFAGVFPLYIRSKEKTSRVPRKTFWTSMGALVAISLLTGQIIISQRLGWAYKYPGIVLLMVGFILPPIVAAVIIQIKRWQDINASAWWVLINAIPYLGQAAAVIVCGFIPGTRGPNRFGPDPLGRAPRPSLAPSVTPVDPTGTTVARSLAHYEQQRTSKSLSPPLPAQPPRTAAPPSLENELRSLAALKADGIISEEEFTEKKRALLGL